MVLALSCTTRRDNRVVYGVLQVRNITNVGDGGVAATLAKAGLQHCKPVMTPGESGTVHEDPDAPQLNKQQYSLYRNLVGRLMWTLAERPDLAFVSKELARKVQAPNTQDWQRLKRLLRYAQRTKSWTLFLGGKDSAVATMK